MSHLLVLVKRLKGGYNKSILFNMAEYLYHFDDYTEEEERIAKKLLNEHALLYLTEYSSSELRNHRALYTLNCIRCGRRISNEESINRGLGPTCYKKFHNKTNNKKQASLLTFFTSEEET